MDLLDRLLGHDAWTTEQLLLRCRGLSDEELDREFDIGLKTVRATLLHVIWNMEAWTDAMEGRPLRFNVSRDPAQRSVDAMSARLADAAAGLASLARGVARRDGWDERWRDRPDDPASEKTYGGAIAHVITHSMHHRSQIITMLRRLGLEDLPEGDVLSWEQQAEGV